MKAMLLGGLALVAPVAAVAAEPARNAATGETDARVTVVQNSPYGAYLADAQGRALYMFTADKPGQSNCYDACAQAWPPLISKGTPEAAAGVNRAMLDTLNRTDGSNQVTYNSWPLYYFVQDKGPGQATGQDKHGFGGEWYLMSPSGEKNTAEQKAETAAPR